MSTVDQQATDATGRSVVSAADRGPGRASRGRVVGIVLFLLVLALAVGGSVVSLPYAVLAPGAAVNTLGDLDGGAGRAPILTVRGAPTYPTDGALRFTTVSVSGGPGHPVDLWQVIGGWVNPSEEVLPVDQVFDPRATSTQVEQENAVQMKGSQQEATAVALRAAGYTVPSFIVVAQLLLAQVPEVAEPAVVAGPRIGLGLRVERGEKARARPPEVRAVVGEPEARALPRPQLDVEALREPPLDPPELSRVEAELQHVRRLRRARELRVDGLVRAVLDALEEVREPAPRPVREVRLVDHVRLPRADRLLGQPPRLLRVESLVVVGRDAHHGAPGRDEPREVRRLVLVALAP